MKTQGSSHYTLAVVILLILLLGLLPSPHLLAQRELLKPPTTAQPNWIRSDGITLGGQTTTGSEMAREKVALQIVASDHPLLPLDVYDEYAYLPLISSSPCDYVESPDSVVYDGALVPAGSTICLEAGAYSLLVFRNLQGTAEQPITITNLNGRVHLTHEDNRVRILNSQHVRLTGTGAPDVEYGFYFNAGLRVRDRSHHIEIDHVELTKRIAPFDTTHPNFEMTDIHIHHCYIHDMSGPNEAIYVGSSYYPDHPTEYLMRRVEINDNILENIGGEGIQVGSVVEDCRIHHNILINVVADTPVDNRPAIMGNAGTDGEIYNNVIIGTPKGLGIFTHGPGALHIYNNLLIDTATDQAHYDAIRILTTGAHVYNNTIIGANRNGIHFASQMTGHAAYNNVVLGTGGASIVDDWQGGDVHHNHTKEDGFTPENYGFADPASDDYHIISTCQGVDAGVDSGLTIDLDNNPRPQGDGYDIGCYERQAHRTALPRPRSSTPCALLHRALRSR